MENLPSKRVNASLRIRAAWTAKYSSIAAWSRRRYWIVKRPAHARAHSVARSLARSLARPLPSSLHDVLLPSPGGSPHSTTVNISADTKPGSARISLMWPTSHSAPRQQATRPQPRHTHTADAECNATARTAELLGNVVIDHRVDLVHDGHSDGRAR